MGVSRSGAFDTGAYELRRRLVDNPPGAAALEVLLGRLTVQATAATWAVITGALVEATAAGRSVGYGEPFMVSGEQLVVGTCTRGIRAYLSVAGGIDVPPVLGSRATDTLSGVGPRPLAVGDVLPLGEAAPPTRAVVAPLTPPWREPSRSRSCRGLGPTGSPTLTSAASGPWRPTRTASASG